jgi:hypothetical protein
LLYTFVQKRSSPAGTRAKTGPGNGRRFFRQHLRGVNGPGYSVSRFWAHGQPPPDSRNADTKFTGNRVQSQSARAHGRDPIRTHVLLGYPPPWSPLKAIPAQGVSDRGLSALEFPGYVGRRTPALDVLTFKPVAIVELWVPGCHFGKLIDESQAADCRTARPESARPPWAEPRPRGLACAKRPRLLWRCVLARGASAFRRPDAGAYRASAGR